MFKLLKESMKAKLILTGILMMLTSLVMGHFMHNHEEKLKQEQAEKSINDFIGTHKMQDHYQSQVGEGQ